MSQCAIAYYRVYLSGGRQITTSWTDFRRTGETSHRKARCRVRCRSVPPSALSVARRHVAGLADTTRKEASCSPSSGPSRYVPRGLSAAVPTPIRSSDCRRLLFLEPAATTRVRTYSRSQSTGAPQLPVQFTWGELKPGTWRTSPEASRALDGRSPEILRPMPPQWPPSAQVI